MSGTSRPDRSSAAGTRAPRDPDGKSPRDSYITIYGRMPVLEALSDTSLSVGKVVVAERSMRTSRDVLELARRLGIPVETATAERVKLLAGNGKQDQGIVADIEASEMMSLRDFTASRRGKDTAAFLLDGVTNPANVGMILRVATAAGIDGIILPRVGTPHINPLVIKASAGVAFRAPVVNAQTATQAADELRNEGFRILGMSSHARESIFTARIPRRCVFVLGGETNGYSVQVDQEMAIPMRRSVESLNVAVAAGIIAFELANRGD